MAEETGIKAEIDAARAQQPRWKPGQGMGSSTPLLPALLDDEVEVVDVGNSDIAGSGGQGKRGPGRPKGSKNRRTTDLIDYYMALGYADPLRGLMETYMRPVQVLMAELSCSAYDAYQLQQDAMKAVLPYWHQKQPMAVQLDEGSQLTVVTVDVAEMGRLLNELPDDSPMRQKGLEVITPMLEQTINATEQGDESGGAG